jgi:hypothetical protein
VLSPLLFNIALELRAEWAIVIKTGDTAIYLKTRHIKELPLE